MSIRIITTQQCVIYFQHVIIWYSTTTTMNYSRCNVNMERATFCTQIGSPIQNHIRTNNSCIHSGVRTNVGRRKTTTPTRTTSILCGGRRSFTWLMHVAVGQPEWPIQKLRISSSLFCPSRAGVREIAAFVHASRADNGICKVARSCSSCFAVDMFGATRSNFGKRGVLGWQ